ncbi:MAG: AsmA-like C-terminal region-containing protein [Terriglobia bacterium]
MLRQTHPRLRKWLMVAGVAILGVVIVISVFLARLSPLSRRWVVKALRDHYHSNVELKSFQVTLFPQIVATGGGLVLGDKDHPGGPPLASIKRFSMDTTWLGLLRSPRRVRHVRLEGLTLNIPPRKHENEASSKKTRHHLPPFYLEDVEADGTVLNTFSNNPQKPPRVFAIAKLRLRSVGVGKAMSFQATLTNPKPIGQIQTSGTFGPWNPADPGQTPVSGNYAFRNADLSTIHGIAGILSSLGKYGGVLDRIEVDGETDTPNFALGTSGNPEHLKTQFHAVVDGVTGQTLLQPVKAQLDHSLIIARGGALRTKGVKGTTVSLNVNTDHARLGDLLRLAVKSSTSPMTGGISLLTQFELPPGREDVEKRLKLKGSFTIHSAQFTDPAVEEKVTHLSERGEGKPGQNSGESAASNFKGHFVLLNGVMSFSDLAFDVPGASVTLHGTYGLISEELNFRGTLRLQAKISQTTTGIKSLLLKAADPLLKGKHAGTVVPIRITGKRQHPSFGVQYGKLLKRIR